MDINERLKIDRIQSPGGVDKQSEQSIDPTEFARLLDRLKKSEKTTNESQDVADVDKLNEAVKQADDDFETAMNLRKMLEDAYRKHQE